MNSKSNSSLLGAALVACTFISSVAFGDTDGVRRAGATVSDVRRSERTVTSRDVLTLRLSSAGGAVVAIDP